MCSSPLLGRRNSSRLILNPLLRNIRGKRVVGIWGSEQGLDGEEDGADLESGGPVALEHIQTDAAELVDVGVVDLGQEADLWWGHGVVVWEKELELEYASFIWRLRRAVYGDIEVSQVVFMRDRADTWDRFCHQPLGLFDDPLRQRHVGMPWWCVVAVAVTVTVTVTVTVWRYLFVHS